MREQWEQNDLEVTTRSVIAKPYFLRGELAGVFFLRATKDDPPLDEQDATFAESIINAAVSAIERAYDLEAAESDKERFRFLANTDPLTGCHNRRALLDELDRELNRARRYHLQLTILMVDLDRFKEVNDTRGHLVGDAVLRKIGDLLRREARTVDLISRYGGEEFTVVLPDTGVEGGVSFAERIRSRAEHFDFADAGDPLRVTVSVGVATFSGGREDTAETMIAKADGALYRAKADGRNLVRQ